MDIYLVESLFFCFDVENNHEYYFRWEEMKNKNNITGGKKKKQCSRKDFCFFIPTTFSFHLIYAHTSMVVEFIGKIQSIYKFVGVYLIDQLANVSGWPPFLLPLFPFSLYRIRDIYIWSMNIHENADFISSLSAKIVIKFNHVISRSGLYNK